MSGKIRASAIGFVISGLASYAEAAPGVPKIGPSKTPSQAGVVRVISAMSTPLKSGHPLLFLNGPAALIGNNADPLISRLQFPADQRYSKWSVIFDRPLNLEAVEVTTCEGTKPFADGVELFVDQSEKRFFADGGRRTVRFSIKVPARALTLHFLESPGLCLEHVRIRSSNEWLRPRVLLATGDSAIADGSIGVASRASTVAAKQKLVGSRSAGEWHLEWENPLIVEKVILWNGNQQPGETFASHDRVQDLELRLDGQKVLKTTLEDRRFSQQVEVPEPRAVRTLDLKALTRYTGSDPEEPMLGEVQLSAGGETWVPVVPVSASTREETREAANAAEIRESGYGDILDRELRVKDRGDVWKFRFRSDGTFFARIFVDKARTARGWSAIGSWMLMPAEKKEAPSATPTKMPLRALMKLSARPESAPAAASPGVALLLTGTKTSTADAFDSLPCGSRCFSGIEDRGPSVQRELPISEQIELQRDRKSVFFLRNRTEPEKRTIDFTDLKVRIHSLYD